MRSILKRLGLATALALAMTGVAQADPADYQEGTTARPGMLTLRYEFGANQPQTLRLNGVPLNPAPAPRLQEKEDSGSNAASIILAIGVAVAIVVLVGGHEVDKWSDGKQGGNNSNNSGSDSICGNGGVPCGVSPPGG